MFGWIGSLFDILYTPIVLYQLAKGGQQPADANLQILTVLAEDKLQKGDTAGAIRWQRRISSDPQMEMRYS